MTQRPLKAINFRRQEPIFLYRLVGRKDYIQEGKGQREGTLLGEVVKWVDQSS